VRITRIARTNSIISNGEPALDAAAEPAIAGVVHDPDVGVRRGQFVGQLAGTVRRCVVHDDQFVVADLAGLDQVVADLLGRTDRAVDVLLLVPHREEDRQRAESLGFQEGSHGVADPIGSGRNGLVG
jgi:hypothetical protein